jgi:hypothetical protein
VTGGSITLGAPATLTANFARTANAAVTKGAILTVKGAPPHYQQTLYATNPLGYAADVTFILSGFGTNVSVSSPPSPTGTTTTCSGTAGLAYYTVQNVAAGAQASLTFQFNAPSAAGLSYAAAAEAGPGAR